MKRFLSNTETMLDLVTLTCAFLTWCSSLPKVISFFATSLFLDADAMTTRFGGPACESCHSRCRLITRQARSTDKHGLQVA